MYKRLSVVIPVYNGETFLGRTLSSILDQTFEYFEVVVVNDGSTDGTLKLAKEYKNLDSRITKIVTLRENSGVSVARNIGTGFVSELSDLIMYHDCDDVSMPEKFSSIIRFMDENKSYSAVGCRCIYIDRFGIPLGRVETEDDFDIIQKSFSLCNHIIMSSMIIRKEALRKSFGKEVFCETMKVSEDYAFWSKFIREKNRICKIPEYLHKVRIHEDSLTSKNRDLMRRVSKKISIDYSEFLEKENE